MKDLIALYRWTVVAGDRALAARLGALMRSDARLRLFADRELQDLPRGPGRWSPAGEEAAARALARIERRTIEPR
jgi:hypothetical protein